MFGPKRTAEYLGSLNLYKVTVTPALGGLRGLSGSSVDLTPAQYGRYLDWLSGTDSRLIQNILPDLSNSQREVLMSGIDQETWDEMMGEEE